jgi:hypothetical protein
MDTDLVVQLASVVDPAQVVETIPVVEIMAAFKTNPVAGTALAVQSSSFLQTDSLFQTLSASTMAIHQPQMTFSPFPRLPLELRRKIVIILFLIYPLSSEFLHENDH